MSGTSFNVKDKILRAGAGAGKTTTLTQTFLDFADSFYQRQKRFPHIIVTTFTRKATQELKERLLMKSLEQKREDLFQYVSTKNQVQISTIHGILSLFLARSGTLLGLTPDFQILSESESRKSARKILRGILLSNDRGQELLEEYDFSTLEEMFTQYYENSFVFEKLRFVQNDEMQKIIQTKLRDLLQKMKLISGEALRSCRNEKWVGYLEAWKDFKVLTDDEPWTSFLERLEAFDDSNIKPPFRKASPPFDETLHEELDLVRKSVKVFLQNPAHQLWFCEKHQRNASIFQDLAQLFCTDFYHSKIKTSQIAMSDLELLSLRLLQDHPDSAQRFSEEWDFWMIDEYQDTSPVQVRLLKALVGSRPIFVVGDPQQSIYLFRGARSQVFQEKIEEIQLAGGDVEVKLVNYRSSPEVLDFFNHYFTKLNSQFSSMEPAPGKTRLFSGHPVVDIILTEKVEEAKHKSENMAVIARVQELLQSGVSPEQICILSRTHRTLEDIAKVAHDFSVPFQLHSGSGFYERREVLDALSLLKFFINPHDNPNFVALLRSPWLYVSDSEILQFCHGKEHSYWLEAQKRMNSMSPIHPLQILKSLLLESEQTGLSWTLKTALVDLGFFDFIQELDSSGRREANLWKLIALLSQEERRPGFNFLDFLDSNLGTLTTEEGGEDSDATPVIEPKRIHLMTVHASKGLQFEHIILPGMGQSPRSATVPVWSVSESDGVWTLKLRDPEDQSYVASALGQINAEQLRELETQEFSRVLYVALTRAKSGVSLLWESEYKSRSWASQFPLSLEEGVHQGPGFCYRVRKENIHPQRAITEKLESLQPRLKWQGLDAQNPERSFSVTEIVEGGSFQNRTEEKASQNIGGALAKAQQGTEAHRVFEALRHTSVDKLIEMSDPEFKRPLQFLAQTKQIPLLNIIQQGFVEWGFALRHRGFLVQGQIDLWGVIDGHLWVVDYKTGSQKYSDMALKQLEVYAWALAKMRFCEQIQFIHLAIVYPLDEVIKTKDYDEPLKFLAQVEASIESSLTL